MKRILWVVMSALLLCASPALAQDAKPAPPPGAPGEHGKGFVAMLEQLNLKPEQKQAIARALKETRDESRKLHDALKQAHSALYDVIRKDPGNEAKVREAYQAVSKAGEAEVLLRAKVSAKIRSTLTPEQISQMDAKREAFMGKMKKRFESNRKTMDDWIEQNSK